MFANLSYKPGPEGLNGVLPGRRKVLYARGQGHTCYWGQIAMMHQRMGQYRNLETNGKRQQRSSWQDSPMIPNVSTVYQCTEHGIQTKWTWILSIGRQIWFSKQHEEWVGWHSWLEGINWRVQFIESKWAEQEGSRSSIVYKWYLHLWGVTIWNIGGQYSGPNEVKTTVILLRKSATDHQEFGSLNDDLVYHINKHSKRKSSNGRLQLSWFLLDSSAWTHTRRKAPYI